MYSMIPFGRMNHSWNDLLEEFERTVMPANRGQLPGFRTDIQDKGDHYLLEAELPGFQKGDIDLHLQDNVLTITAKHEEVTKEQNEGKTYVCRERRVGSVSRSFDVSGIDEANIQATYDQGILTLTLPKQGPEVPQSRKIAIQ